VSESLLAEWPRRRAWRIAHYNKKGSLRESYLAYLAVSPDLHVHGRGSDDLGFFILSGQAEKTIDSWAWLLHKRYVDSSLLFGDLEYDDDEFDYGNSNSNGNGNGGVHYDNNGDVAEGGGGLAGRSGEELGSDIASSSSSRVGVIITPNTPIRGVTITPSSSSSRQRGYLLQERIQAWLMEDEEGGEEGAAHSGNQQQRQQQHSGQAGQRAHQSMIVYWRRAEADSGVGSGGDDVYSRESFFGVVEMNSKDSHFHLDPLKGGVVRAAVVA
jgi:hypothetical protein